MDISTIMKLKSAWDQFTGRHPKFPAFLKAARAKEYTEGTVIYVKIVDPSGQGIETNVKLTQEDIRLLKELKNVKP